MADENIDILDIVEEPGPDLREDQLLKTIWLQPRQTLRYIFKNCPEKFLWPLLIIGGMVSALGNSAERGFPFGSSGLLILLFALIGGGILGPVLNMVFAGILRFVGGLLGGKAKYREVLITVAWSLVPTIASVVLIAVQLIYFGTDLFTGDLDLTSSVAIALATGIGITELALGIWTIVIMVIGLSEANGFGIGRAILNLVIPFLAIVIPLAIIAFILGDLFS